MAYLGHILNLKPITVTPIGQTWSIALLMRPDHLDSKVGRGDSLMEEGGTVIGKRRMMLINPYPPKGIYYK